MNAQLERPRQVNALRPDPMKLLLPVDATERSRWGINYAIWRKHSGHDVAVSLLFVAEPVTSWEVLRFMDQERVRRFQAERGGYLLEDAAQPLEQAGIRAQLNYREGDIVFHILDVAEQLACNEIVLPVPAMRWTRLFSPDIVREAMRRQRSVPVTTVTPDGTPEHPENTERRRAQQHAY